MNLGPHDSANREASGIRKTGGLWILNAFAYYKLRLRARVGLGVRAGAAAIWIMLAVSLLLLRAGWVPACQGLDGRLPPWGGSGANGLMAAKIQAAQTRNKGQQAPPLPPVQGTQPTVILLIENAAQGAPFNAAYKPAALWQARLAAFDRYYNEVSRGLLRITPAAESYGTANDGVIGPLTVSGLSATTNYNTADDAALVAEALRAAQPYIHYASFDKNHDGVIQADELHIVVYQAGNEAAYNPTAPAPNTWSHMQWYDKGIPGLNPLTDTGGVTLTSYCYGGSQFTSAYGAVKMATMGTMTHELGHDLGLPDLYDADKGGSGGAWNGLGRHCLMASGEWGGNEGDTPVHLDGFFKDWLGWATALEVTAPANLTRMLPATCGSNAVIRVNASWSTEFFIIENRQHLGFDAGLPGTQGGLAIYHGDAGVLTDANVRLTNSVNTNPDNPGIMLEQADGSNSLYLGLSEGSDADYYRVGNNTTLDQFSMPSSQLKDGEASGVRLTAYSTSGTTMSLGISCDVRPMMTSLEINGGDTTTGLRMVTLNNTCVGNPVDTIASERADFADASWQPYTAAPAFELSEGAGVKTVYLKIRDSLGEESAVLSDTIQLDPIPVAALPVNGTVLEDRIAAAGGAVWYALCPTAAGAWRIESQPEDFYYIMMTVYGPGDMSTMIGHTDNTATGGAAQFNALLEPLTYYVKVEALNRRDTGKYTITARRLAAPLVVSFAINNGAATAASRTVTLNQSCTGGTPSAWTASESPDFVGATWGDYSTAPAFTLNTGNGLKTVYFKVRDAYGQESPAVSDTITLNVSTLLTLNGPRLTGNVSVAGEANWYHFTIGAGGGYTIETWPGTLADNVMWLYGPGNTTTLLAQDDDSGTGNAARIRMRLNPGTYHVRSQAKTAGATGTYTIRLTRTTATAAPWNWYQ